MNDSELVKKIEKLAETYDKKTALQILANDNFIKQHQYKYLKLAFNDSTYKENNWKWHQLVRITLKSPQERKYMYNRFLHLLLKHRHTHKDYFIIKTKEKIYQEPNILTDLNKLEILYEKYFQIYQKIINQIHFDSIRNEYVGEIRGKINWDKTVRMSTSEFPVNFVTLISQKIFETPENILLVLGIKWMHKEANRLLEIKFNEPLTNYKKNLLRWISEKSRSIFENFPFKTIFNNAKRFLDIPYDDFRIKDLEHKTKERIEQNILRNGNYTKLLGWINEFRDLDIISISSTTSTSSILESIKNLDTVYEAWIFLEFVEYIYEKQVLTNFQLGNYPNCEFMYNGSTVTFWYEKTFTQKGNHAWALEHRPDFVAMMDDKILCIFDAKNYTRSSSTKEPQNKMLSYMNNLDTNFGGLIFPNHPKIWDDFTKDEKIKEITMKLKKHLPDESKKSIKRITKKYLNMKWAELPQKYKQIFYPHPDTKWQSEGRKNARFHFEQTLTLLRLSPKDSKFELDIKNKTLDYIFDSIVKRIPLAVEMPHK